MAEPVHLELSRLPSAWATFARVLFTRRPPVTEVEDPPEIRAIVKGITLDARSIERYATMCGFDAGPAVPITYPHVLAMPLHVVIFAQRAFLLRPMGLIHLTNTFERPGTLEAGARLDIEVAACNYRRTDAGLAFDVVTNLTRDGQPVWREVCVLMSRWPEPVQRSGGRPPRPPKAPKDSTVLAEIDVTVRTAWAYARVSGDFNPIHLSERAARYFGLRGAIGHGMWSLARSLAQAPPPDCGRVARVETQFLTPVQLPGRVTIKEWTAGGNVNRALCDVRTGRVHMVAWWEALTPPA